LSSINRFQLDAESNALAGTKPRERASFDAIWEAALSGESPIPGTATRVIIADSVLAGTINIFAMQGSLCIGYWIDREQWGRGIATRAIALMLAERPAPQPVAPPRAHPLIAHVVAENHASRRALERNGFTLTAREQCPDTERYLAAEVLTFTLV
jgi:RimJ/RimL family protein N-acetyltransferase